MKWILVDSIKTDSGEQPACINLATVTDFTFDGSELTFEFVDGKACVCRASQAQFMQVVNVVEAKDEIE